EAVPRAHEVASIREAQAGAALVGGERFLDLAINLPLAHRAARVRAHVLIGEDFVAQAEHADLDPADGKDAEVAVGESAERRDRYVLRSVSCHVVTPERDGTTSPRRTY